MKAAEEKEIAEKILNENLIGVNKNKLGSHHDFKPSILNAMQQYAEQYCEERLKASYEKGKEDEFKAIQDEFKLNNKQ